MQLQNAEGCIFFVPRPNGDEMGTDFIAILLRFIGF
jgi:hypothetical protein